MATIYGNELHLRPVYQPKPAPMIRPAKESSAKRTPSKASGLALTCFHWGLARSRVEVQAFNAARPVIYRRHFPFLRIGTGHLSPMRFRLAAKNQ